MEVVAKQRKSVIKRQKKQAEKIAAKTGPVVVHLKNVPTSNRKMRLVADLVRGKEVNSALNILKFQAKQGAARLEKLLVSAMADWEIKRGRIDESEIVVKEIFVDGGKILKRLRPAPQGRAHRVRKRSNHVTLILDTDIDFVAGTPPIVEAQVQEAKPAVEKKKTVAKKEPKTAPKPEMKTTKKKTETK